MTNKRLISIITAMLFLFTVIFSVTFIASYARHECVNGDDCVICSEIENCQELLHHFATAQTPHKTKEYKSQAPIVAERTTLPSRRETRTTLVSLKIKLSN